jgi:hypothetical protein
VIRYTCPRCRSLLESPDHLADRKIGCPHCGQRLQLPPPQAINKTVLATPAYQQERRMEESAPPVRLLKCLGRAIAHNAGKAVANAVPFGGVVYDIAEQTVRDFREEVPAAPTPVTEETPAYSEPGRDEPAPPGRPSIPRLWLVLGGAGIMLVALVGLSVLAANQLLSAWGPPEDFVWLDDAPPPGAQLGGAEEDAVPWTWGEEPAHPVLSGRKSMKLSWGGFRQFLFYGASPPLTVHSGDVLFAYVWVDPQNSPKAVGLQFKINSGSRGSWNQRAYWGADLLFIPGQADGPMHRYKGPLPAPGKWTRLEVSPAEIGLEPGAQINGIAFSQYGGTAYYDKVGVRTRMPPR